MTEIEDRMTVATSESVQGVDRPVTISARTIGGSIFEIQLNLVYDSVVNPPLREDNREVEEERLEDVRGNLDASLCLDEKCGGSCQYSSFFEW